MSAATAGSLESAPLIYLIAGEPSGDALGGGLMAALKLLGDVRFAGIGGARMAGEGLASLFPIISVMAYAQITEFIARMSKNEEIDGEKID